MFASAGFFTFNVLADFFFTKYFWNGTGSEKENEKRKGKIPKRKCFQNCWSIFVKIKQHKTEIRN